jgi:diguanylate cyclase (GGDEF)-like protein/PAS domain S-box-containing protein
MKSHLNCYDVLDNLFEGVYCVNSNKEITYWNRGAERITGYCSRDVLGSKCSDNILVHIDKAGNKLCLNDCPLLDSIMTGRDHLLEGISLHHKKGHRVPIFVSVSPIKNKSGRILGAIEVFQSDRPTIWDKQYTKGLRKMALLDTLTGIPNRRFLEMKLDAAKEEKRRHNIPFGVLFIDVDKFKHVNDSHGHETGDEVLKMIARTMEINVRAYNTVGRWGGEEFLCIINHIDSKGLMIVAEKLRNLIENSFFQVKKDILNVTVTIGAALAKKGEPTNRLLKRADEAMYDGKKAGRNRTVLSRKRASAAGSGH